MTTTDDLRKALREDFPFYAESILKITTGGKQQPFKLRPPQERLWDKLEKRRAEGKPLWVIILKSRKIGFSTMAQGLVVHRTTLRPNHTALTVAQDSSTAQELFRMSELMWKQLPTGDDWDQLELKPAAQYTRRSRELHFGEPGRARSQQGYIGLNSKMLADTAGEFEAKRGFTAHTLHLSEVAFWPNLSRKLTSLLNTVPRDDPETVILIESTANGYNEFKTLWDLAEQGRNDFEPFFVSWLEDDSCRRPCLDEAQFVDDYEHPIGDGPYGEDEPALIEMGATLEQLAWRRYAIANLANGDLGTFNQEYPSTAAHAFQTTGRSVFAGNHAARVIKTAKVEDPKARRAIMVASQYTVRTTRHMTVKVPTHVEVKDRPPGYSGPTWKIFEEPEEKGQYVVVVDPASGEENTVEEPDDSAIQIINHRTGKQVAELKSKEDPEDVIAEQAYLACLRYSVRPNKPLLVVEMTGGHGRPIVNKIKRQFGYGNVYRRRSLDPSVRQKESDLLGWSTDRATKNELVAGMKEVLGEQTDGIRSVDLAFQVEGYTRLKNGRTAARADGHDDLLSAYMIGKYVCQERPPRPEKKLGVVSTATRRMLSEKMGY